MSGRVSGLSDRYAAEARRVILLGVELLMVARQGVHYTQGPARWQGIAERLRIAEGEFPHYGDCSSTHSWLLWNALTHVGVHRDLVNAANWEGGYTGTIASHGKEVVDIRNAKVGDAILYGSGTFQHVATYIGGGRAFSHGSEAGPFIVPIDYRGDRAMTRRHI